MPPVEDLYWRGLVLWDNDGMTWKRIAGSLPLHQLAVDVPRDAKIIDQDITLLASGNSWLYTLDAPVAAVTGTALYPGVVHEWPEGPAGTTTYHVRSSLEARPRDFSSFARTYALKPPRKPLSPAVIALPRNYARERATKVRSPSTRSIGSLPMISATRLSPERWTRRLRSTTFCSINARASAVIMPELSAC